MRAIDPHADVGLWTKCERATDPERRTGSVRIGLMRTDTAVGNATDSLNGHSSLSGQANTVIGTGIHRRGDYERDSMQQVQPHHWRRYGFGGPPEPWERSPRPLVVPPPAQGSAIADSLPSTHAEHLRAQGQSTAGG